VPSEQEQRAATARQFVVALGAAMAVSHRPNTPPTVSLVVPGFWLLVPGSLGFMGLTQLLGTHSATIQLTSSPNRRAMHD
jgi:uncharacterized membrane protein YjjB (DUF3815 family)